MVVCKKVLVCPLIKSLGWPESKLKISSRSNEGAINCGCWQSCWLMGCCDGH